ncbi:MAG: polysaccharide biosynthesis/export family protein [Paracoccaceae bacterium]
MVLQRLLSGLAILAVTWVQIAAVQAQEMSLAEGDAVEISIYGREDLSGERKISGNGTVAVPLLGRITAAGLSAEELEVAVAEALEAGGLIQSPSVLVQIVRRGDIYVDGDVGRPSAFAWRPGMSVRQAVSLAGGLRPLDEDTLGTVLEAYRAREGFEALMTRISNLEAEEARLMAEVVFVEVMLDGATLVDGDKAEELTISYLAEHEQLILAAETRMQDIGIDQVRPIDFGTHGFGLINFPPSVANSAAHNDLRRTHESLIEKRIAINIEQYNSMRLQVEALQESLNALSDQLPLVEERIAAIDERFQALDKLRTGGYARATDVLALQNALSLAQTNRLETIRAIGETRAQLAQQALVLKNFVLTLTRDLETELRVVRTQLSENRSRVGPARRAAALAEAWEVEEVSADTESAPRYAILARGSSDARPAEPGELLRPGDTLLVTLTTE